MLCIYVAIGQKASSIARVAGDLQKHGAMSYTTIVAATASDSASLQYIAPYAGTALAEYFMSKGKSVLVKETGWADADATPTHIVLQFSSSHGGAYVGTVGNTFWVDNVGLVY